MLAKALNWSGKKTMLRRQAVIGRACRHERFTIPLVGAGVPTCTPV